MGPIDALYENGLLRPVSDLPLRPGERVTVIVVRKADPARWDLDRLAAHGDDDLALAESGLDEWAAALDRGIPDAGCSKEVPDYVRARTQRGRTG